MNTETKQFEGHTPGPYFVDDGMVSVTDQLEIIAEHENNSGHEWTCIVIKEEGETSAVVALCHSDNAPLLASAPELLKERDALKKQVEGMEESIRDRYMHVDDYKELERKLRESQVNYRAMIKAGAAEKSLNAELLEALKELNRVAGNELTQGHAHAYQKMLNVIAKAEGREHAN